MFIILTFIWSWVKPFWRICICAYFVIGTCKYRTVTSRMTSRVLQLCPLPLQGTSSCSLIQSGGWFLLILRSVSPDPAHISLLMNSCFLPADITEWGRERGKRREQPCQRKKEGVKEAAGERGGGWHHDLPTAAHRHLSASDAPATDARWWESVCSTSPPSLKGTMSTTGNPPEQTQGQSNPR